MNRYTKPFSLPQNSARGTMGGSEFSNHHQPTGFSTMRVWHAFWLPDRELTAPDVSSDGQGGVLCLWGERTKQADEEDLRSSESDEERNHPFALSADELRSDLAPFDLGDFPATTRSVPLPSKGDQPLPCLDPDASAEPAPLERWSVECLVFSPLDTINLLSTIPEQLPHGLQLGETLRYWIEATKFLLDMLSRGRFLPSLLRKDGGSVGHWRLLLTEPHDQERLETLLGGIPPACLAFAAEGLVGDPRTLLLPFLEVCADDLIRAFARRLPFPAFEALSSGAAKHLAALQWFQSLTAESPEIHAPAYDIANLEQRLRRWNQRLFTPDGVGAVRTSFRLLAPNEIGTTGPDDDNPIWLLEIWLHCLGERDTEIPLAALWQGDATVLSASSLTAEELEVQLLHDIGRASAIFPPLVRALNEAFPVQLTMDTREAYQFLKMAYDPLVEAGFEVHIPAWWRQPATGVGLRLDVQLRPSSHQSLGLQQLLDFSWSMVLGDQQLSVSEFSQILSRSAPLVRIDGRWVEIDPQRAARTLEFVQEQGTRRGLTAIDALRFGLGGEVSDAILPIVGFNADGWLSQLLAKASEIAQTMTQPKEFLGSLRPYQLEGLAWLAFLSHAGVGGCLADDMGLGKTIQLLALLAYERESSPESVIPPTLLVVPMSILENWQREATRFTPQLKVVCHHGPARLSGEIFLRAARGADLVLTTYNLVYRDESLLSQIDWHRIALDEAQSIKNLATKQTQAVRRLMQAQLKRDNVHCHRVALTGTPLENHLEELWSIFDFLNPGYLGSLADFRSRFSVPIERYRDAKAQELLGRVVRPFVLRRLKRDPKIIQDLPEKIEMEEYSSLTTEQAALYQNVIDQMLPQVDSALGIHRKGLVLATITRLKQICDHPTLYLKDGGPLPARSGKLARLTELCETLVAEGDKVLIFTQYAQMGELLKGYLQDHFKQDVLFLHGALTQPARTKVVDRFQNDESVQLFILSLKAGGLGLNLTAANQVIHYDQWWNPAVEQQATDRAYRIGQKRNVQVRKLICKGTLEEKISELLFRKKQLAENIVSETKSLITQMDTEELRGLLELSASLGPLDANELRESFEG